MELVEAMRTTGTCRYFSDEPVPDDVLYKAFDSARFGPQGGVRQPVRWIVVRDAGEEAAAGGADLPYWDAYFNAIARGGVNVGALPETDAPRGPLRPPSGRAPRDGHRLRGDRGLHVTDADLDRASVVGGGWIYPTVQNFCLALRDQGVGSAVTTLLCHEEPKVRELLNIPDGFLTACHIAVGYPAKGFPKKLTRTPVEEIVGLDDFATPIFT